MTRTRACRTLLRVYQRRGQQIEEALLAERRALLGLQQAERAADEARAACVRAQQEAGAEREALLDRPFTPHGLQVMDLRVQQRRDEVARAEAALAQAARQVQEQQQALAQCVARQRRNGQRIESFGEAWRGALRQADAAQEENDDEEAAEGFVARMLAARRAAAAAE